MKACLFVGTLLTAAAAPVCAESLDIGGIELRLGQKADDALRLLSSYQVQYYGGSWVVFQKTASGYEPLGLVGAKDNVVSFISKSFQMNEPESAPDTYTAASKELRRRGGTSCVTREVTFNDGRIQAFETQCGIYILTYYMPSKADDGTRSLGGVSIAIRSR